MFVLQALLNLLAEHDFDATNISARRPVKNRTLVVLTGNLRCGELAWQTLKENVLDVNYADLALMIGNTLPRYANASVFDRAKFVWTFPEYEDWGDAIDLMEARERERLSANQTKEYTSSMTSWLNSNTSWRATILPRVSRSSITFAPVKGFRNGAGAIQFMNRYHLQERIRELGLLELYDRFVITRTDNYFRCALNLTQLNPQFIWVPKGSDWGGINDRMVIVNSQDVMRSLDAFPAMIRNSSAYPTTLLNANPETFLLDSWTRAGIRKRVRRFDRVSYICMTAGDQTSWGIAHQMSEDGVHVKKPDEYKDARETCNRSSADPEVYCPLRQAGLQQIVDAWEVDNTPIHDHERRDKLRQDSVAWFKGYLEECSGHTQSIDNFRLLRGVYTRLVGTRGISDDPGVACDIIPSFTRVMAAHPACIQDTLTTRGDGHGAIDSYEIQCVTLVYKAAFAKLRQAAANSMYTNMVSSMRNLTIPQPFVNNSQECKTMYDDLFQEALAHSNGIPWNVHSRTPQVLVGPKDSSHADDPAAKFPQKGFVASGPKLRSIPLWSKEDLLKPFADTGSNRLKSPGEVVDFLEERWRTFLEEVDNIPDDLWTDPYPFLNPVKGGWSVYVLYKNHTFDDNRCTYTPRTCDLLKTILPATKLPFFHIYNEEAGFFRMQPGSVIAPHSGPVNTILNTHVGLRGVEGAKFFVNGTEVKWREGGTFSFEDSFEHWGAHASNATQPRVIFMIRQMHPDVRHEHYTGHKRTQAGLLPR